MHRRSVSSLVAAAILILGAVPMVWAQRDARLQLGRSRRLKACVGLIPTMGEPDTGVPPLNRLRNAAVNGGGIPDPDAISGDRSPNPNPFIFYVMNQRKDLRPDGVELYNPAAPQFVTQQQNLRWQTISGGASPSVGSPLTQDVGAYWEVNISEANYNRLAEMDLIYLPVRRAIAGGPLAFGNPSPTFFTEEQRRVLTSLASSGVTIWVDWAMPGATTTGVLGGAEPTGALALPEARLKNAFFTNLDFLTANAVAAPPIAEHPLLNVLYQLTPVQTSRLGSVWSPGQPASYQRAVDTRAVDVQPTANFTSVVPMAGGSPLTTAYVAAARYGSGFVVATAGNVGGAISTFTDRNNPGSPLQFIVRPGAPRVTAEDLGLAEDEDLRFAWNVLYWATESTAQQKNSQHTGQSSVQLNGLIEQYNYPYLVKPPTAGTQWPLYPPPGVALTSLPANPTSPLVINGTIIAQNRYFDAATNSIISELNAFEANPNDDFDRNLYFDDPVNPGTPSGNPLTDFSIGQPYDRIMSLPIPGNNYLTGMALGEVPDLAAGSQGAKGYVFAAGTSGLFSLPAPRPNLPPADYWTPGIVQSATNPAGVTITHTGAPGFVNLPGIGALVNSVVISGGVNGAPVFGGASNGKVVAYNVAANGGMGASWYYPGNQESNRLGPISGPVSVAQMPDRATGAVDTVAFTTSVSSGDLTGGQGQGQGSDTTGRVDGFVLATRGEPLAFPTGTNPPSGGNPNAGRRFIPLRILGSTTQPQAAQSAGLEWDPTRYYEVRVMDKARNYVLARFVPGTSGFQPISPASPAGVIELPTPTGALTRFAVAGQPNVWNLNDFVLLADYSVKPRVVDGNGASLSPTFQPPTPYVRGAQQNQTPPTGIAGGVSVGRDGRIYYGTGIGYMCCVENRRGRPAFPWKVRSLDFLDSAGQSRDIDPNSPTYLADYRFVAAPAAGDRIVFASHGSLGSVGTAYVMEPDYTVRFKLPISSLTAAEAAEVRLEADHGAGVQPTDPFLRGDEPAGRSRVQFTVDPDTATVTFQNMENFSLDLNRAEAPNRLQNATVLGIDTDGDGAAGPDIDTGGRPATPIQFKVGRMGAIRRAFVPLPLVAYYQTTVAVPGGPLQPERFLAGPSIAGSRVYLSGASGYLHEIPLEPKGVNPAFPARVLPGGGSVPGITGFDLGNTVLYGFSGMRKLRNVAASAGWAAGTPVPIAPVTITEGMMVATTRRGMTVFSSPNIVVADSNRILETSGDSFARVTVDLSIKRRLDNSEFPIPTDPQFANTGGRPILEEKRLINRPSIVQKLNRGSSLTSIFYSTAPTLPDIDTGIAATSTPGVKEHSEMADESYLMVETGNNRVVELNPAGTVIWEATSGLQDPFGLLPAGEKLSLAGPTDAQRWIEEELHPTLGRLFVVHTLICDEGNSRIIEVVDKIQYQRGVFSATSYANTIDQVGVDGTPIRWYHVVVWSSQTNAQGIRLKYRTARRIFWQDATGGAIALPRDASGNPIAAGPARAERVPPYLPPERSLSYTMATTSGQQVFYAEPTTGAPSVLQDYFRFHATTTREVAERKPEVRTGGDSVVFLRGRWTVDERSLPALTARPSLLREPRITSTGTSVGGDTYRFGQGVIDPNLPILNEIWDEVHPTAGPIDPTSQGRPVHKLSGVTSVQRTVRADGKFAADTYNPARPMARTPFFLIADQDGVWEARLLPGNLTPGITAAYQGANQRPQYRLAWAFTSEDYTYVTGGGNGDPTQVFSPNPIMHTPGGRRFTAASAKRLPNGLVLIASPTSASGDLTTIAPIRRHQNVGADVFLLRSLDYRTAFQRQQQGSPPQFVPYRRGDMIDPGNRPLHGWQPDLWVQTQFATVFGSGNRAGGLAGAPSIRWRAAEPLNPLLAPTQTLQIEATGVTPNPYELSNSYIPVQPNYADLVYW